MNYGQKGEGSDHGLSIGPEIFWRDKSEIFQRDLTYSDYLPKWVPPDPEAGALTSHKDAKSFTKI